MPLVQTYRNYAELFGLQSLVGRLPYNRAKELKATRVLQTTGGLSYLFVLKSVVHPINGNTIPVPTRSGFSTISVAASCDIRAVVNPVKDRTHQRGRANGIRQIISH